jgi:hypothetical protein
VIDNPKLMKNLILFGPKSARTLKLLGCTCNEGERDASLERQEKAFENENPVLAAERSSHAASLYDLAIEEGIS